MFALLNPISLWFAAALAVPLMIHFLGRQRLQRKPFPSLLLVSERFSKSMHRHRLKNLLLLILRTLLILCVLLALANPALESRQGAVKPDLSLALIHNGIYGRLRMEEGNALETQWSRLRALDSGQGGVTQTLPVIGDGPGAREVSERFGDYGEAIGRILGQIGMHPGIIQIQLPVFAWTDLTGTRAALLRVLQEKPGLQLVLTDFSAAADKLNAFAGLRATAAPDAPALTVQARLAGRASGSDAGRIQVTLNGRLFQEVTPSGGIAEVTLPMGEGPRLAGRFSLPKGGFAAPDLHFCFPETGSLLLGHSGSDLASLPSLGRESYYRRIAHVASVKDMPWTGSQVGPGVKRSGAGGGKPAALRLAYIAAERGAPPEAYARAVEFVKRGGRLIIGVGRDSDVPLLNRFLLQPLRLGRLGNLVESPVDQIVGVDRQALAGIGRLPANRGAPGTVRKRFAYAPDSGTAILLYQGTPAEAVLAARDFQRGKALLWTTDIDDLDWTDLGVSALTPLLHQAFQEADGANGSGNGNLSVASDSVYTAVLEPPAGGEYAGQGAKPDGANALVTVRDPEDRPFTKVTRDGSRLRIGPFDKFGIHRIFAGKDTFAFAVNLAQTQSAGAETQAAAKAGFMAACEPYRGRVTILEPGDPAYVQSSVRRLWPAFLLAAILLLLLEGLISATFSLRRNRP
ncbi:MAG: BatA domain-containing protein [Fibrobacteria bacterium]